MAVDSVGIVGAGLAGMSLALALGERSIKVHIVDLDSTPSGSGITIGASALRMLDRYGVGQAIIENGTSKEAFLYSDSRGNTLQQAGRAAGAPKSDYPVGVDISRLKLAKVLKDAAERRGVKVVENVTVKDIDQNEDRVHAVFSDGTSRDFSVLVGADGIRSVVRKLAFSDQIEPSFSGFGLWRWILPNPGITESGRTYVFEDGSALGVYPLPDDELYVFMLVAVPENKWIDWSTSKGIVDGVLSRLGDPKIDRIRATLLERDSYIYRPLETFFMKSDWYRNRVILIGDAAHAMTPHLGSGGVMAIEDALVLDDVLAKHDNFQMALSEFMSRRYDRVKYIYDTSLFLADLRRNPSSSDFQRYGEIRSEAIRLLETTPA